MKKLFVTAAVSALLATSGAGLAAGPKSENPAFSNDKSPNNCGNPACISNGVVQFGANGGIANTHGQAGLHANEHAPISNPGSDAFSMNVKPRSNK